MLLAAGELPVRFMGGVFSPPVGSTKVHHLVEIKLESRDSTWRVGSTNSGRTPFGTNETYRVYLGISIYI